MRLAVFMVVGLCLLAASPLSAQSPALPELLDFELGTTGDRPTGWGGGPEGTIFADSLVVHGGKWAARIERGPESPSNFSSVTAFTDQRKQGKFITLRGYLKTEDVDGMSGLWLRLDGHSGNLGFDNMHNRPLKGTNDWAEYTIVLP